MKNPTDADRLFQAQKTYHSGYRPDQPIRVGWLRPASGYAGDYGNLGNLALNGQQRQ